MSEPQKKDTIVRCSCGSVELEAIGAPIMSTACYCDDCQEGARQIEALPNARPVRDPDGGTAYLLYRKDRIECSRGAQFLQDYKITEKSGTKRVVATCCNSAMFLSFEKGHWFSVYRARFQGDVPPLQMRVQTKSSPRTATFRTTCPVTRRTLSSLWRSSLPPGLQCCFIDEPWRGAQPFVQPEAASRLRLTQALGAFHFAVTVS